MGLKRKWLRIALLVGVLAGVLGAAVSAPPDSAGASARTANGTAAANAQPAADETTTESVAVPLAAGGNLVGWFGLPTTSAEILAGNSAISVIWVFDASTQTWSSDSAALPSSLRTPLEITQGTGLFLVTSAATELSVPTARVFTTNLFGPLGTDPDASDLGEAVFRRTVDGASVSVEADSLIPGNAYTVWWVIWNDPTLCDGLCGEPDLGIEGNSVPFAAGAVASEAGTASFNSHLTADGSVAGQEVIAGGLTDPVNATIHVVVRDHGPALTGDALIAQLTLFEESAADADSVGDGFAFDVQAAVNDGPNVSTAGLIVFQSAPFTLSPDLGASVSGESTLVRTVNGLSMTFTDNELEPGDAYSIWWLIFNNPAGCTGGCGEDEVGAFLESGENPAELSALNATGGVADSSGSATFSASLAIGDEGPGEFLFGEGVTDSLGAEVHLIIRTHGPASEDADTLLAQTSTFGGSCDVNAGGTLAEGEGFACLEPHASIHMP